MYYRLQNKTVAKMKVLVLNDSEHEFNLIKDSQKYTEIFHACRYLQFLHQVNEQEWDIVYLKDDFSSIPEHDSWVDGNGFKQLFSGIHAARAIASLAEIGKCPAKKVVISQTSNLASTMRQILLNANVNVSKSL